MKPSEREDILKVYRIAVRNAIASRNSEVVSNSSPQHASIIIEEMLDAAKDRFIAFSGAFRDDVWNALVIDALRRALRRGVEISLVATETTDRIPEELKNVSFVVNKEQLEKEEQEVRDLCGYHFAVADGCVVRVEYDLKQRLAAFSANRPDVANVLIDHFLRIRNISRRIVA